MLEENTNFLLEVRGQRHDFFQSKSQIPGEAPHPGRTLIVNTGLAHRFRAAYFCAS